MGAVDLPRLSDTRTPKATNFCRAMTALVLAKGEWLLASQIAMGRWPTQPEIAEQLRSAVNAGQLSGTWGGALATTNNIVSEFVALIAQHTIIGRLAAVHKVPFKSTIARETTAAAAGWVGEGAPKAMSELAYDSVTIDYYKAASQTVVDDELIKMGGPAAEQAIRSALVRAVSKFLDQQFVDPSVAAAATHPASITNGQTAVPPSGTTAAAAHADLVSLLDALLNASSGELVSPLFIMSPRTAVRLGSKADTAGGTAFPNITAAGGNLLGIPVLTSLGAGWSVSGGGIIVLLDQDSIMVADDGEMNVRVSTQADVQQSTTPSAGAQQLVSLFQQNKAAILCERAIAWAARRPGASVYLDASQY